MILLLASEIDLGRYIEVMKISSRRSPWAERVVRSDWPSCNLSTLTASETLYVSAHGDNAEVEDKDPGQLADLLVSKGLKESVQLKKLKLMSCGSGITSGNNVPYCLRLAQELADRGGPKAVKVVGFDGASTVCDEFGKILAKDVSQSNYVNWHEFVSQHQTLYAHWNTTAENMPCTNEVEFKKNAETLWSYKAIQEAFGWLYANNKTYTKGSAEGKTFAASNKPEFWKK